MFLNIMNKLIYIYRKNLLRKKDNALIKKHPEWKKLSIEEKKIINKNNYSMAIIAKNLYSSWNLSDKEFWISDSFYQLNILPKLNWVNSRRLGFINGTSYFSDKNYQSLFLQHLKIPNIIIRKIDGLFYDNKFNLITMEKANSILNNYEKLVFKVSIDSAHGHGVTLVQKKDFINFLNNYSDNFVVQDLIKQCNFLNKFNSTSVNIIRVTSLLLNGNVYILSGILRVGPPGAFCDLCAFGNNNPRIVALDDNGKLIGKAIDPNSGFVYSDIFGQEIDGIIPNYNKIIELIKKEHIRFAHHKIIGWDITIDINNEIICVEFNSTVPGIVQSQMVCGPIFSKKTNNNLTILEQIINEK